MASPENICYELFELLEQQSEQEKAAHARGACLAWIASGLYLYATTPAVSLLSLSAIGFFILGPLAASVIIGGAGYWVQRAAAAGLARTVTISGPWTVAAITIGCWLLLGAELAVGYELAKTAFASLVGQ